MNEVINSHRATLLARISAASNDHSTIYGPFDTSTDGNALLAYIGALESLVAQYNDGLISASELVQKIVWEGTR